MYIYLLIPAPSFLISYKCKHRSFAAELTKTSLQFILEQL